ncbi:MAG: transketolase [Holosporales bacterium]|jgi:transketolase|nr:transketolase [Holosporales bacterium]
MKTTSLSSFLVPPLEFRQNASRKEEGIVDPQKLATALRFLAVDMVEAAQSGHLGMPLGMAEVVTALCQDFLTFCPKDPRWPGRDRLIFSGGHGSALLYGLLYLLGYERPTLQDLQNFRQLHAPTTGHPEYGVLEGVEATTGPLGQGIAMAVGLCAALVRRQALTPELPLPHTYVLVGDGDLMEGVAHEAMALAGHLRLGSLIVLWDDNGITIDGPTSLSLSTDFPAVFLAENWHVCTVDGHDSADIRRGLQEALADPRPSLIRCRTEIGHGSPHWAGTARIHSGPIGAEERCQMQEALGWPHAPFEIPEAVLSVWRAFAQRSEAAHRNWPKAPPTKRVPAAALAALEQLKEASWTAPVAPQATRCSSRKALEVLAQHCPSLIGGSADLTPSTGTHVPQMAIFIADTPQGRYVHYGVREHGMAAFMNGLALEGTCLPYGGTFLAFSDYMRPAIRLSALMQLQVLYIFTHDSIALGEDGPTHQPIEQLMSLRLIPNLHVFRPADAVETYECWACALNRTQGPSALILGRQELPLLRPRSDPQTCLVARGGYILEEDAPQRQFTLLATGSEVALAQEAKKKLNAQGLRGTLVSLPCWELFEQQDASYRRQVLGEAPVRVSIEAGSSAGWEKYTGDHSASFGVSEFGLSGKGAEVLQHFGLTPEAVYDKVFTMVKEHA